jgi:hypothetical protein
VHALDVFPAFSTVAAAAPDRFVFVGMRILEALVTGDTGHPEATVHRAGEFFLRHHEAGGIGLPGKVGRVSVAGETEAVLLGG